MNYYHANRFQNFFEENKYTALKNYLYNYHLRKMAVEKNLQNENTELILEVGSGISPVMMKSRDIIYSDLSFSAIQLLKHSYGKGYYVVADGMRLPFKTGVFSHAISSEVLEHLKDDRQAISELARVLKQSGHFIVTFPHKKFYFAIDDRFVGHFRRYEINEMTDRLTHAGFKPVAIQKVLGPLDKVTMCFAVLSFSVIQKFKSDKLKVLRYSALLNIFSSIFKWANLYYAIIVWIDARIMPRAVSTVLLMNSVYQKNQRTPVDTIN
jgi:ubiquinone/menaquinone biosynthesis C-methylase UbiE